MEIQSDDDYANCCWLIHFFLRRLDKSSKSIGRALCVRFSTTAVELVKRLGYSVYKRNLPFTLASCASDDRLTRVLPKYV